MNIDVSDTAFWNQSLDVIKRDIEEVIYLFEKNKRRLIKRLFYNQFLDLLQTFVSKASIHD
jgi:hypothetical protein